MFVCQKTPRSQLKFTTAKTSWSQIICKDLYPKEAGDFQTKTCLQKQDLKNSSPQGSYFLRFWWRSWNDEPKTAAKVIFVYRVNFATRRQLLHAEWLFWLSFSTLLEKNLKLTYIWYKFQILVAFYFTAKKLNLKPIHAIECFDSCTIWTYKQTIWLAMARMT